MAKVQFNCRLEQETIDAINLCAARYADAFKRKVSQAEVIERTFDGQLLPATVRSPQPRKVSKKAAQIEALKASDPMGAGREDIEHGNMELPSGGSVALAQANAQRRYDETAHATPDVNLPSAGSMLNHVADWRAGRKPLLKPSERGKK